MAGYKKSYAAITFMARVMAGYKKSYAAITIFHLKSIEEWSCNS